MKLCDRYKILCNIMNPSETKEKRALLEYFAMNYISCEVKDKESLKEI